MNVLERIVSDKRQEVQTRKAQLPLSQFVSALAQSDRDFKAALKQDFQSKGASFILECKKASPSKGLIREQFDLDEICEAYSQYASCVSVLTDEKYFQGEFERLPKVKQKLPQPVLCKDFFIDPYQVHLARHFGANAILLMLSVLDDQEYQALADIAKSYSMAVLTEVSNEQEMARAVALKADILGINNRNLRDLSTDLNKTPELVALFKQLACEEQQQNTILISESGIYHHQQVKLLLRDVQGFLVGSSLMAQPELLQACRDLIVGEHKVCGLKTSEAVQASIDNGAKYQGLIFVETSPRAVSIATARQLVQQNPAANFVAVVRDMPLAELVSLIANTAVKAVQLHGNEDADYIDQLRQKIPEQIEIWQAFGVSDGLPKDWPCVDKIVLDTKAADGTSGGTGQSFNWQLLQQVDFTTPLLMLAGGINPDNSQQAATNPVNGLDINSGVESAPGVKSPEKITKVFNRITNRTTDLIGQQ